MQLKVESGLLPVGGVGAKRIFGRRVTQKRLSVRRYVGVQVLAFDSATSKQAVRTTVAVSSPPIKRSAGAEETHYAWRNDFYDQYEFVRKLNAGSFGEVWLAKELETGKEVAVKELKSRRGRLTPERVRQKVEQELRVMTDIGSCPAVVGLKGGYILKDHYEIVMEHCSGQDLKHHAAKYGPVSEQLSAAVAREILQVIRMCHENNIVHGDIKTSNFILKSSECNPFHDKSMTVLQSGWLKAIDFGCSQLYQDDKRIHMRVGTPVYMAPEVFQRDFGMESDMWSLGVVLFQLLAGTFPFWRTMDSALMCSVQEVSHVVQTRPVDFASRAVWRTVSPECKHFVRHLLSKDYTQRMTLSEAEQHPFLSQNISLDNEGSVVLEHMSNIVEYNTRKATTLQ